LNYGKVNLLDISARADAAIAEFRTGKPEAARKLLSLSGAGMISKQGFAIGTQMQPPDCDPARGLTPDQVAVVEFSIRADGSVGNALPIYFSGKPAAVIEFARAVSDWTWTAAELKEVSPFFRSQTRLELRCSTASRKPNALGLLWPEVIAWFESRNIAGVSDKDLSDAQTVLALKQELAKRDSVAMDSIQSILPLHQLAINPALNLKEAESFAYRALQIAKTNAAPPPVQAFFHLLSSGFILRIENESISGKYTRSLNDAIADPAVSNDPTARSALNIALYDSMSAGSRKVAGRAILSAISNDSATPANDPYKVGALIRLANLEAEEGRMDDARSLFQKSGLSAQQCALVDATPRKTGGGISDGDYPREALTWGFGGWTVVEFDIDAEGRTQNVRPLISFPPFVFGDPTVQQIRGFRYEQSYRPEGGLGCGGQQQRVSYRTGL
jgi:hypothetical protein